MLSKRTLTLSVAVLALALGGCQVRPLYSDASPSLSSIATPVALKSISVNEVDSRYGQEVRNQLIFLLNGGAGEPASPTYKLDLGVTTQTISTAAVAVDATSAGQPTAGGIVLTSLYVLTNATNGEVVTTGKRSVTASFDRPAQQFASLRAQRDAENRAARELAELVRLALAADLSK